MEIPTISKEVSDKPNRRNVDQSGEKVSLSPPDLPQLPVVDPPEQTNHRDRLAKYRVQRSLCRCTVQTGSLIIGSWEIVQSLALISLAIWVYGFVENVQEPELKIAVQVSAIVISVIALIDLVFAIILVVGVYKKEPKLLKTWIYYALTCIVLLIVYQFYKSGMLLCFTHIPQALATVAVGSFGACLLVYYVVIVNSYYWNLIEDQSQKGVAT